MPVTRITIELKPDITGKLKTLVSRTHQNQTDVVNRAIELFEYIEAEKRKGREVVVRDRSGKEEKVKFF